MELVTCDTSISWELSYLCYFCQGINEIGMTFSNADNVTKLEPEFSVLPNNTNGSGAVDICDRTETKIIGGSKAGQGDFPYQVII